MSNEPIAPQVPFIWPEPRVSAGSSGYAWKLPLEGSASTAQGVFGVVSAIDTQAVDWIEAFLDIMA